MTHIQGLRTGKLDYAPSPRDLLFATYVDATAVPKVPKLFGHEKDFPLQMFGNGPDNTVREDFGGCGDCVLGGGCEETHLIEHASGRPFARMNGLTAVTAYSAITGYVIGNDSTDQGTNVRDALSYRRKHGIVDLDGKAHKIGAYLALEPGNVDHLALAMYVFGVVGIGIQFPGSAMDQFDQGKAWTVVKGASIEGGHYIPLVARRSSTQLECITWGKVQKMALAFYEKYCDEAWAIVPTEYLEASGKSPEGFDQAGLVKILGTLG